MVSASTPGNAHFQIKYILLYATLHCQETIIQRNFRVTCVFIPLIYGFFLKGMAGRIEHICNSEGVTLADDHVMPALHSVAGGDLRKAITTLQSAVRLQGTKVDRCACNLLYLRNMLIKS